MQRSRSVVAALLCLLTASLAVAQPSEDGVREALSDLSHANFARRDAATQRLLKASPGSVADLAAWFASATSLEAQHRLRHIAEHHLHRLARLRTTASRLAVIADGSGPLDADASARPGGIGIGHRHVVLTPLDFDRGDPTDRGDLSPREPQRETRECIIIDHTQPGFPGHANLQEGDLIVGIAGQRFGKDISALMFREVVQAHAAGGTIRLEVLRVGKPQTIAFQLADANDLVISQSRDAITNEARRLREQLQAATARD